VVLICGGAPFTVLDAPDRYSLQQVFYWPYSMPPDSQIGACLFVGSLPVRDASHFYERSLFVVGVDCAIVADPDAPFVISAAELL
jgi:hypothetical protein